MSIEFWNRKNWMSVGSTNALVLLTILASLIGCKDSEFSHHELAVAQFYGPESQPDVATVRWQKIDSDLIESVCSHLSLQDLSICGATRDGSPIFPQIAKLPKLETLCLVETPVTDDELRGLSDMVSLKSIELSRTGISGVGLQYLSKLPLKRLVIRDKQLSTEGLQAIASMTNLEELELDIPGIHWAEMPKLASTSKLKSVIITDGYFSYREFGGLKFLMGATNLTNLQLSGNCLNDRSLKPISTLSNLRSLTIGKSVISEEGIEHLSKLEHLQSIAIPTLQPLQNLIRLAGSDDDELLPKPIRS